MKTIILCGGQGTRMREETEYRPKPLVEVGGRPILWHIMKIYSHYGFNDFILCLGYRGNMIKDYFLQYEAMNNDFTISLGRQESIEFHSIHKEQGLRVTLADTGLHTMTGGRVQKAQQYVNDDLFLLTYGDGVADVDLTKLLQFHKNHGKLATLTAVRPTSRYGMLQLSDNGRIEKFSEKPKSEGWANAGFFVMHRRVFDYLTGPSCVLEREPLERLAMEQQLVAYQHDGFFFSMDTFREYQYLNELWDAGKSPWKVW
jgi:glucose-1-phosphate cytidylyltransferase